MDYYFRYLKKELDQVLNKSVTISNKNKDKKLKKLQYITIENLKSEEENIVVIDKNKSLDNCIGYKYIKIKNVNSYDTLNIDIQNIVMNGFCNMIYLEDIKYNKGSLVFKNNRFDFPFINIIEHEALDKIIKSFVIKMKDKYNHLMIKPLKIVSFDEEKDDIDLDLTKESNFIIFYIRNSEINNVNLKIEKNQNIFIISVNSKFNMNIKNNECQTCKKCPTIKEKPVEESTLEEKPVVKKPIVEEKPVVKKQKKVVEDPIVEEKPVVKKQKKVVEDPIVEEKPVVKVNKKTKNISRIKQISKIKKKSKVKNEQISNVEEKNFLDLEEKDFSSEDDDLEIEPNLCYQTKKLPVRVNKFKKKINSDNYLDEMKEDVDDLNIDDDKDSDNSNMSFYEIETEEETIKKLDSNSSKVVKSFYLIFLLLSILSIVLIMILKSPKGKISQLISDITN